MNLYIKPPFIKLDNLLKLSSLAGSGGHAKIMITNGEVFVDDSICTMRGKKIVSGQTVRILNGETIKVCTKE